jgi:hypothetical protein
MEMREVSLETWEEVTIVTKWPSTCLNWAPILFLGGRTVSDIGRRSCSTPIAHISLPAPPGSHPSCRTGTTWMQQVLSLIFCEGNLWPIRHLPNWIRAPRIEHISFSSLLAQWDTTRPPLLTTHLCAKALAPALMKSKTRVRESPPAPSQVSQNQSQVLGPGSLEQNGARGVSLYPQVLVLVH